MKKFARVLLGLLGLVVFLIVGFGVATAMMMNRKYDAPYPKIQASQDAAVIARGKYLATGAAHCMGCHGNVKDLESNPASQDIALSGGRRFFLGPLGAIYAPNITPDAETGIGSYTDQEIARSLRHGVSRAGHVLLPIMPFQMVSEEDMTAIISYLRSVPAVKNEVPKAEWSVLGKVVKTWAFKPEGPTGEVPAKFSPARSVEYGKYLAHSVANCYGCHTDRNLQTGQFTGPAFAGGFKLEEEGGTFVSVNLTPIEGSPMHVWSEQQFIDRFRKMGRVMKGSPMPWEQFNQMTDDDLGAVYRYLKTVAPAKTPGI